MTRAFARYNKAFAMDPSERRELLACDGAYQGADQALGPGMKHSMSGEKSAGGGPKP